MYLLLSFIVLFGECTCKLYINADEGQKDLWTKKLEGSVIRTDKHVNNVFKRSVIVTVDLSAALKTL